jgi:hypothetical protein
VDCGESSALGLFGVSDVFFRTLIADLHVNSSSSKQPVRTSISSAVVPAAATKTGATGRAPSIPSDQSASNVSVGSGANPMSRPVRKLSVREATLEDRKAAAGSSQHRGSVSGQEATQVPRVQG